MTYDRFDGLVGADGQKPAGEAAEGCLPDVHLLDIPRVHADAPLFGKEQQDLLLAVGSGQIPGAGQKRLEGLYRRIGKQFFQLFFLYDRAWKLLFAGQHVSILLVLPVVGAFDLVQDVLRFQIPAVSVDHETGAVFLSQAVAFGALNLIDLDAAVGHDAQDFGEVQTQTGWGRGFAKQIQGKLTRIIHTAANDLQVVIPHNILQRDVQKTEVGGIGQALPGPGVGGPYGIVVYHRDLQKRLGIILMTKHQNLLVIGVQIQVGIDHTDQLLRIIQRHLGG